MNRPVSEVPIMMCQGEVRDPAGIELVIIDSKGNVAVGSRSLRAEAILNIYRTMHSSGGLSAECFTTVFSGSTLVCILKLQSAKVTLEISNFMKLLGCLYPDSWLFYMTKMSAVVSVYNFMLVADNFLGAYPHRFLLTEENVDDRRMVIDHYDKYQRKVNRTLNPDQSVRELWERSGSTYKNFDP